MTIDRTVWLSRRSLLLHLTVILLVPVFVGLCWWQVQRVRQGNELSWAYVFEWPFFAGYAMYLWWHLIHEGPEEPVAPKRHRAKTAERRAAEDRRESRELAQYNLYLKELDELDEPKTW